MRNDATNATKEAQKRAAATLPPEDHRDDARATRGFIGTIPDAAIGPMWSLAPYAFVEGEAPATVHPSLWRQA